MNMQPEITPSELPDAVLQLLSARRTILPRRLTAPGPRAAQKRQLFMAAATAPDHDQLQPWRFIEVPEQTRPRLADVFGQALRDRDPDVTDAQIEQARDKAYRAPLLLLLVVCGEKGDSAIDVYERMVSAGAAVQNLLLMATAQGFGSAITSGKALKTEALRQAFQLAPGEFAPCFISIGTVTQVKPGKSRPDPSAIVSCWEA